MMKPSEMVQATEQLGEVTRSKGITHARLGRAVKQDRTLITKVINQQREIRRDLAVLIAYHLDTPLEVLFTDRVDHCPSCGWSAAVRAAA